MFIIFLSLLDYFKYFFYFNVNGFKNIRKKQLLTKESMERDVCNNAAYQTQSKLLCLS